MELAAGTRFRADVAVTSWKVTPWNCGVRTLRTRPDSPSSAGARCSAATSRPISCPLHRMTRSRTRVRLRVKPRRSGTAALRRRRCPAGPRRESPSRIDLCPTPPRRRAPISFVGRAGGNGPRPPEGDGFAPKTFGGPAAGGGRDPYGGHPVGAPTGHFGGPSGPRGPSGPSGPTGPTGPNSHGSGPKRTWALALVALGCIGAMVLVVGGGITFLALNQSGGEEVAAPLESESATTEPTSATETDSETDSPSSSAAETTEPPEFEVLSPIDRPQGDAD